MNQHKSRPTRQNTLQPPFLERQSTSTPKPNHHPGESGILPSLSQKYWRPQGTICFALIHCLTPDNTPTTQVARFPRAQPPTIQALPLLYPQLTQFHSLRRSRPPLPPRALTSTPPPANLQPASTPCQTHLRLTSSPPPPRAQPTSTSPLSA